jgi:hypothetical protein
MAVAPDMRRQQQTAMVKYTKQHTRRNSPLRALACFPSTSKGYEISSGCYPLSTVLSLLVFFTCLDPELFRLGRFRHQLPQNLRAHSPENSASAHGPTHNDKTSNRNRETEMAPIQINLSAPIYGSNGTGIVPNLADERVEVPDSILAALTVAFKRKLAEPGPQGDALRAMFGKQRQLPALHSCMQSTNIECDAPCRQPPIRVCC